MKRIAILGAGMVGRAIAVDLSKDYHVTSFDQSEEALSLLKAKNEDIETVKKDLSAYDSYAKLLIAFDIVVSAVPGFMGYKTLEAVIHANKNAVDISFFPEDALLLDSLAKEKKVTIIVDCGVAPGMSNIILGYHDARMNIDSFECYVGGLPIEKVKPFEYKAPFSPVDVVEEYLRPARFVENGEIMTKPAMTDNELLDFPKAGVLEAFNTDGLRSLLFTMPHIKNMKEKTLRYPGHIDLMKALISGGFFSDASININGQKIIPKEFSCKILFPQWKLGEKEKEFTVMRIIIQGREKITGRNKTITYDMYDEYDEPTNTSSMARTTGYTCNAAVNILASGMFGKKGVFPPEQLGKDEDCFQFISRYLGERNVDYKKSEVL